MTGKRPRALTRTASVSQLGSGNFSQEFSPLPENPKEKLKPTIKEPSPTPSCAPRVVIGFDPKPSSNFECAAVVSSPQSSAPCSPSFHDNKASSPRSVLNSLFSRQQRVAVKPSCDGVGLGIALHVASTITTTATPEDDEKSSDHIAIPVHDEEIPVVQHHRRHSHPIPTPGISPCRSHHHHQHQAPPERISPAARKAVSQQPAVVVPRGWIEVPDAVKVDRRDTFLLVETPARGSVMGGDVTAALTASSHFLDECSFCKRHLPEDKDIFMYKGDKAFCSVECRSQQMILDERSKNCSSSALQGASSATPSRRAPASSVAAA